ncbi:DUF1549 domain-containing protein [Rubripirellula sp.]|nr:DUF1549 domain-containing protein [Rubripirellula sp.]MDB4338555.1 DUF1549 domain-containing protein [Rubripirellula sp.]
MLNLNSSNSPNRNLLWNSKKQEISASVIIKVLIVFWVITDGFVIAGEIDFSHDIVPILKKHCVECHGGIEAKGGFSINSRNQVLDSGFVEAGDINGSVLLQLVSSDDPDQQMPPTERARVSNSEFDLLKNWIAEGASWADGFDFSEVRYEPALSPRRPVLPKAYLDRSNPIDRLIDDYQRQRDIATPEGISDSEFLRRVSLDLIGLLPTVSELQEFVADESPDKRELVIDRLLDQSIDYADHWMSFFNDLLRNDYSGTGFITGGRRQISDWLYQSLLGNKPYDVMVRELISPSSDKMRGFIDGIKWRGEVSAGQTIEIQFAQSVAQSFLGINLKCASCHDSFIDRWTLDQAFGLAAVYAERPLEIHRCDKPLGRNATPAWLFPKLGQIDPDASRSERLSQLAELMTDKQNGRFARTIVNRLWYQLLGHGIVHPLDAMQTRPWSEDLLDFLAVYLVDQQYDLKSVLRLIVMSAAYQSKSSQFDESDGSNFFFEGPLTRRLTAEQFLDGVWQVTGAAPGKIDAPIVRAQLDGVSDSYKNFSAKWIWGPSAENGQIPPSGETITFKKVIRLTKEVLRGGAVVTCDNTFKLYVNGLHVGDGNEWNDPQAFSLQSFLRQGENEIVIVASNGGNSPNPAGLFFEARLDLEDEERLAVTSDKSWKVNLNKPAERVGHLGSIAGKWIDVTLVASLEEWEKAVRTQAPTALALASTKQVLMVRASLIKNNAFQKSLGRPMREQIVSMRPTDLSTLEAMDLSNGEDFSRALQTGARNLLQNSLIRENDMITYLYQFAFSRLPTIEEKRVAESFLGQNPEEDQLEDVMWSIFMSPEFLLIR